MISLIFSTVIQFILVLIIPVIYYLIKRKPVKKLFYYLGIKKSRSVVLINSLLTGLILALIPGILFIFNDQFRQILRSDQFISGSLPTDKSIAFTLCFIFITSYIKTALTEEIFFRGFIAKGLAKKLPFNIANFLQALLFGIIHLLFMIPVSKNLFFLTFSFIFPFLFSFIGFYINEKKAEGSIFPSILIHGTGNFIFYLITVFG